MQGLKILTSLLSNYIKLVIICTYTDTVLELSRDSLLQKSAAKWMIACLCTVGQNFKVLQFVPGFSKTRTLTAETLRWFYKETNPGAASLILDRRLIYRHCGSSQCDFTGMWAHFCWSTRTQSLFGTQERIGEAFPHAADRRLILWTTHNARYESNKSAKDRFLKCVTVSPMKTIER